MPQFGGSSLAHATPLWQLSSAPTRKKRGGPKRILVLMSDTGGGHRASAEAVKAGFEEEFGDKYKIDIVDIWAQHTPYPFNQVGWAWVCGASIRRHGAVADLGTGREGGPPGLLQRLLQSSAPVLSLLADVGKLAGLVHPSLLTLLPPC